ncbi:MAG: pantoate--beta-alanine ligase [Candidatus Cloacimonas sp. 4484_275]|nr:MAG: pantoate--beta-alanine ligase [Candidatus Cloacimonas sp. 4484_275]RLC49690.1 MAG: pantoate--beta-alanine ligase [Candidatus Cloacimonadota bacterium]
MKPKIITSIEEMKSISGNWKGKVGFVPTMGYLHEGHLSLVKAARKECETVVVSIFVNPTQFAPNEDLQNYPRDFERDIDLLSSLKVDFVFFPSASEMYPKDFKTWVSVEKITNILCGKSRPTHFRGVTTVVAKLINLVRPNFMYMGEKDFQQIVVLEQMIRDLNFSTKIVRCPLIREKDGLAMSSRNKYLSETERKNALCLYNSLLLAKKEFQNGNKNAADIREKMKLLIEQNGGKTDYIEFVNPQTLETVDELYSGCKALIAVFIGKTRLIDNITIE